MPGKDKKGQTLTGVIGRKAATVASFAGYTNSIKTNGIVWSAERFEAYVAAPKEVVPGGKMKYDGLAVVATVGGKVALGHTNTIDFCIPCREMKDHDHAEYSHTIHAHNRTGVKAACADCHVPHGMSDLIARKIGAANDAWEHLRGRIDARASFEAHRLELA